MKDSQKGAVGSFIVLILAAVVLIGGIYYYFTYGGISNQSFSKSVSEKISDTKTYKSQGGFSFSYPSDYVILHEDYNRVQISNSQECSEALGEGILFNRSCIFYDVQTLKNKITVEGEDVTKETIKVLGYDAEKITSTGDSFTQILIQFQKNSTWYIQTLTFDRSLKNELKLHFISNSLRI